ncbi:MAG: anaerobic selenocysteine-containing dehydrogenase [Paraglaciecola sp.]|jgi:anaerobic selenocysteine-containing dehydrogenase
MTKNTIDVKNLQVSEQKDWAAGVTAVVSAYKNVSAKIGPIKGTRLLAQLNQIEGFDCLGCAWPDPLLKRSTFEFCENGAKAVADEATLKRATSSFFSKHIIDDLKLKLDRWLNDQGRLVEPLFLAEGAKHYKSISWSKALELIVRSLTKLKSPNQAVFYTSGRISNDAAFLY